ncbi:NlpC/P60 family protein [Streptomyces sp. NPDC047315]|uniref:C40 family peptidase n=1 Tax=Streptomyces sp. NPDC047315 TaxID=3155142 RepID=UPI0033D905A4
MSHTAHIPSHRKPRQRSASAIALRAGVAGGVLSTIAVAGAAAPASADPVTETVEMPAFDVASSISHVVQQSAANSQQTALEQELQLAEDTAASKASETAKKTKAEAVRKAEAEKAEAKKRAAEQERASRTAERTSLSNATTASASASTGSSSNSSSTAASGSVGKVISFLKAQVGDAYVLGATGPNSWDCSSLVQAAFRQINIDLPRVSQDQSTAGRQVGTSNLKVGDILYWGAAGSAYHTGVYIGDGKYLDAANPRKGVVIQDLSGYPATGAVRVL